MQVIFTKVLKEKPLFQTFYLIFPNIESPWLRKLFKFSKYSGVSGNPLLYFPFRKNANSGVSNRSSWWLQFWYHDSSFISFLTISKLMCMLSGNTWHNHHYHEGISIWQPYHNTDFHIQFSKWDDTGSFVCYCFTW